MAKYMKRQQPLLPDSVDNIVENLREGTLFNASRCKHHVGTINGLCVGCNQPSNIQATYNTKLRKIEWL